MVTMTFIYVLIWIAVIDLLANYLSGHLKQRRLQSEAKIHSEEEPNTPLM